MSPTDATPKKTAAKKTAPKKAAAKKATKAKAEAEEPETAESHGPTRTPTTSADGRRPTKSSRRRTSST